MQNKRAVFALSYFPISWRGSPGRAESLASTTGMDGDNNNGPSTNCCNY